MATNKPNTAKKNQAKKRIALIGGGIAGATLLFFGGKYVWGLLNKSKEIPETNPVFISPTQVKVITSQGGFPIQKGSKGELVKLVQQAILRMGGSAAGYITSTGGADGKFGSGLEQALNAIGYPVVLQKEDFERLIAKANTSSATGTSAVPSIFDATTLAKEIKDAAWALPRNLNNVIAGLAKIKSVGEYQVVNEAYKKLGLVSKTIVTDLLDYAFKSDSETAKQLIRNEFLRIGLKTNGTTWTLGGLGDTEMPLVQTINPTSIRYFKTKNIERVGKNVILGHFMYATRDGKVVIKTIENKVTVAPSSDIILK